MGPRSPAGRVSPGFLVALGVAALAFLLYLPTLRYGFTNWDDDVYVIENPEIQSLTWTNAKGWWTTLHFASYAPVTLTSLAVDHALWGLDPKGYHLINVVLHALACALFALAMRCAGASLFASALSAAIFAAHPAQVESVAWVSQRKALLAMVFLLGAYLAWHRAFRRDATSLPAAGGALALFGAAILSKATVALMPLVFLLGDWALRRDPWPKALLRPAPLLAAGIAITAVTRAAWLSEPVLEQTRRVGDLSQHVALTADAIGRYARILLFPMNLTTLHDPPVSPSLTDPWALIGACFVTAGALGFVWAARRAKGLLEWMGFFWIGLLLVLPVLTHPVYLAERFLHVPLLGFSACAGIGADVLWHRLSSLGRRVLYAAALGFGIACLASLTLAREPAWRDSVSLWSHASARPPVRWTVYANYGEALQASGDLRGAVRQYERALERYPEGIVPLVNLGGAWALLGEMNVAEGYLRRAVKAPSMLTSDRALAARSLGVFLGFAGRPAEAVPAFQAALRADPADTSSRLYLARTLRALGRLADARLRFEQFLEREPGNREALAGLAGVEIDAGRLERAVPLLEQAMRGGQPSPEALLERARLRLARGDRAGADRDLARALDLAPPGALRDRIFETRRSLQVSARPGVPVLPSPQLPRPPAR